MIHNYMYFVADGQHEYCNPRQYIGLDMLNTVGQFQGNEEDNC